MRCLRSGQDFVERLSHDVDGRGFEEDTADADGGGLLFVFRTNKAGGEDDRNVRANRKDLASHFEAGDTWHGEVGDDGGEAIRIGAKFSDGGERIYVACDVVAEPFEEESAECDESFFVVDEKYVFVVDGAGGGLRDQRSGVGS